MHELAIAESVLDVALRAAEGRRVTRVQLRVGHLRQVVPRSLGFGWEMVTRGTAAEGAALDVEAVPTAGLCRRCGAEGALPAFPLACESCGSVEVEVVRGEELLVDWIELDD